MAGFFFAMKCAVLNSFSSLSWDSLLIFPVIFTNGACSVLVLFLALSKQKKWYRLIVANQAFTMKTSPRWTINAQKKAATFVTNGGIFTANSMEILSSRLGWIYEHKILRTSFSSLLWRCFPHLMEMVSYCFPCAQFSKGWAESSWSTWRLSRILRSFEPKQACTYTASISQRNKHFNKKSLLSILFIRKPNEKILPWEKLFYSSCRTSASWVLVVRIKNYSSRMSGRVKVFCPLYNFHFKANNMQVIWKIYKSNRVKCLL